MVLVLSHVAGPLRNPGRTQQSAASSTPELRRWSLIFHERVGVSERMGRGRCASSQPLSAPSVRVIRRGTLRTSTQLSLLRRCCTWSSAVTESKPMLGGHALHRARTHD